MFYFYFLVYIKIHKHTKMIEDLKKQVLECNKCKRLIHCKESNMSPAIMNHPNAKILFIATNPGIPLENEKGKSYEEVLINSRQGKFFLSKFLALSNLKYEDVCWSNLCKCPSPNNSLIMSEEIDNCFPILKEQIKLLKNLEYIIILGTVAREAINLRLTVLNKKLKIINFPHPSFIFRTGQYHLINNLVEKIKDE